MRTMHLVISMFNFQTSVMFKRFFGSFLNLHAEDKESDSQMSYEVDDAPADAGTKERYERLFTRAQDDPRPVIDLSFCNLSEIPSEVYSYSRVLRKKEVILNNNKIRKICQKKYEGESLNEVTALFLQYNQLCDLGHFDQLVNLSVLNLSYNRMREFPALEKLVNLQSLDLTKNKFEQVPSGISKLRNIKRFSISHNRLKSIPDWLCDLPILSVLSVDGNPIQNMPSEVLNGDCNVILKYLAQTSGRTNFVERASDPAIVITQSVLQPVHAADYHVDSSKLKHLLDDGMDDACAKFLRERDSSYEKLSHVIHDDEVCNDTMIKSILTDRLEASKRINQEFEHGDNVESIVQVLLAEKDELINKIQHDENAIENWCLSAVDQQETSRKERALVLESMKADDWLASIARKRVNDDYKKCQEILHEELRKDVDFANKFLSKQRSDENRVFELVKNELHRDEEAQIKAFTAALLKRDEISAKIRADMSRVEKQLYQISTLELETKERQHEASMAAMEESRKQLAWELKSLLQEQDDRHDELKKAVQRMAMEDEASRRDFWISQYYNIMLDKPAEFGTPLSPDLLALLANCCDSEKPDRNAPKRMQASELAPFFQRAGLTTVRDVANLSPNQLASAILPASPKTELLEVIVKNALVNCTQRVELTPPSAPPSRQDSTPVAPTPSAPPSEPHTSLPPREEQCLSITSTASECVVCMDKQAETVLIPCGHVCCCSDCGVVGKLVDCPLCRKPIGSVVKLFFASK